MRLMIAGGGTGGHLYPGLAVAREWLSRSAQAEVHFVGSAEGIEARILPKEGLPLTCIRVGRLKGEGWGARLNTLLGLFPALVQCYRILLSYKPDLVIGVGGYASGPLLVAAWMRGLLTVIHEQNSLPGLTNRLLGKIVRRVFISFPDSKRFFPAGRASLTGNPVRREIAALAGAREAQPTAAVLVFGGSQGAHRINLAVKEALAHLEDIKSKLNFIHQTGVKDEAELAEAYRQKGFQAEVQSYIDDMPAIYRRADLIICRAGATSIAEILCAGLPAVYIPFPYAADNHQEMNAQALAEAGAAYVLPERELTPEKLAGLIRALAEDPEKRRALGRQARELARPQAAADIVNQCFELAAGQRKK